MIIESIQIENFQCFYGKLPELKLGRGCTVIYGRNSAGKSKFFNAFCWCFMNRYYETKMGWREARGSASLESLISKSAIERHKEFDVSVEIKFELDDEEIGIENLTLRRSFHVSPSGPSSSVGTLSYSEGKSYKEYTDPEVVDRKLDSWFDPEIRKYMWFQGETLDELVQFERKDSLQSLTKKISHYRHYEDLVNDGQAFLKYTKRKLEASQTEFSKDKRKANEIETELRGRRNELDHIRDAVTSHLKNIKHCEESRLDAEAIIEATASSAELLAKAKESEVAHQRVGEELEAHRNAHAVLHKSGELLGLHVDNTETFFSGITEIEQKLVKRKEELGAINQTISLEVPSQSDLEKLIDAERCDICGTEAPTGSIAYENMVKRLEEMRAQSNISSELKQINLLQKEMPEVVSLFERRVYEARKQQEQFESQINIIEAKWVDAVAKRRRDEEALIGISSEAGNFEENKRRKRAAIEDQKKHRRLLDRAREREVTLKNQIAANERDLASLSPDDKLDPLLKSRKVLAEFALGLLGSIRDQEKELLLDNIEKEANEIYGDLLRGAVGVVATLKIDRKDMSMDLVDQNGNDTPDPNSANWISAKVALITSVLKLTKQRLGTSYPMISDAATSDMDPDNAKNYVRVTSAIFDQTIIFSKDFSFENLKNTSEKNLRFYTLIPTTIDGKKLTGQETSTKDLKVEIQAKS